MAQVPSRYELQDRIAIGGMAEVYRAKAYGSHGFEKTLAIKRILPELASDPEFEERFIAEAKLTVGLSHANIVQVLDFGRLAGTLFLAMELVQGLDLAALLKFYNERGERIPIPAAFQIAMELVRGLAFAHQNGVVHRDVSPSNILLSRAGEVKIADFGIALVMQGDRDEDKGRIMGKWRYMSPEQTRGANLTARSDLFSAAAVIYEIFSGEKLFKGETSDEITQAIHNAPIPSLAELREGVPADVDEILGQALVRDDRNRDVSGDEMLRALTQASYRSKMVSTAIDVADAVAEAARHGVEGASLKPSAGGLDALIRAQLANVAAADSEAERRTAVAAVDIARAPTEIAEPSTGTIIRRGVDSDGVTIWGLDSETVAAIPSALRKGTDSPEEPAPSVKVHDGDQGRYEETGPHPGLKRGIVLSGIGFTLLAGLLIVFVSGGPTQRAATQRDKDAGREGIPSQGATLIIDSDPAGADIELRGHPLAEKTPYQIAAPPGEELEVLLHKTGFADVREVVKVAAGETYRLRPTLRALQASLIVITHPDGATVRLDGESLGLTPLTRTDLAPGTNRKLTVELRDHRLYEQEIDLIEDKPIRIEEHLKSTVVYGSINIGIENGWAKVSADGKYLGDAPGRFRLPVGRHTLRLVNPVSGEKNTVSVDVLAERVKTYSFKL